MPVDERSISLPEQWAKDAQTTIPAPPVPGIAYRNTAITPEQWAHGQDYSRVADSAQWNQMFWVMSGLLKSAEQYGVMPYSPFTDYPEFGICMGVDGKLYHALQPSGPNNGGAQPTSNTVYWTPSGDVVPMTRTITTTTPLTGGGALSSDLVLGLSASGLVSSIRDVFAGAVVPFASLNIPTLSDDLPLGLSLDGAIVSLSAFPRLSRVVCPTANNSWAPAWYKCDAGGTRNTSGAFIRLDDWRGGFPQALDLGSGNTQSTVLVKTTSGSAAVTVVNNLSDGGTLLTPKTSTGGIYPGLAVSGAGIPAGAKVASVSGTTVTLTVAATATAASVEMTVTGRVLGSWQGDAMRNITGHLGGSIGNTTTANGAFMWISKGDGLGSGQYGVNYLDFVSSRVVPIAPTIRPAGPTAQFIILV